MFEIEHCFLVKLTLSQIFDLPFQYRDTAVCTFYGFYVIFSQFFPLYYESLIPSPLKNNLKILIGRFKVSKNNTFLLIIKQKTKYRL